MARLEVLIDNDVPQDLADCMIDCGYAVQLVRDRWHEDVDDEVFLPAAKREGLIIVTWDQDFRGHAARSMSPGFRDHRSWGLLLFECRESQGASLFKYWRPSIEMEFVHAADLMPDCMRLWVEVNPHKLSIHRSNPVNVEDPTRTHRGSPKRQPRQG